MWFLLCITPLARSEKDRLAETGTQASREASMQTDTGRQTYYQTSKLISDIQLIGKRPCMTGVLSIRAMFKCAHKDELEKKNLSVTYPAHNLVRHSDIQQLSLRPS